MLTKKQFDDRVTPTVSTLHDRYWVLIFIGIVLSGVYAVWVVGRNTYDNEKARLINRVETIAASIDGSEINVLHGDITDIDTPAYDRLKSKMTNIRLVNDDARFVYLMGYPAKEDSSKMFFYVDSESPSSPDYSAPGDIYDETSSLELKNFLNGATYIEGPYSDKWGSWVSGYAPILNKDTGVIVATVGIDIQSAQWRRDVLLAQALPLSLTVSIFLIVLSYYLAQKRKVRLIEQRLEFVSIASHQLRNPLSGIKWALEMMLAGKTGELSAEQREYMAHAHESNERMIHLVGDLLITSRIDESRQKIVKENTDIVPIFKNILIDLVGQLRERNATVTYMPHFPQTLTLSIDPKQMREVFMNVISNAIKYSHENGVVEIGYSETPTSHIFSVTDHGVGIPEDAQKRMFQRFFRAPNALLHAPDGNGLGLNIAKHIVERHGGRLSFISKENSGTTFFVELKKA